MTDLAMARADKAISAAQKRADRIRNGMRTFIATRQEIVSAYTERDWVTLGYRSFEDYVESEFSETRLRLSAEERREAVTVLRAAGMSQRAIGSTLGVDAATVNRDLRTVADATVPDRITGTDGREQPASRPKTPEPVAATSTAPAGSGSTSAPAASPPSPGADPAPVADPAAEHAAPRQEPDLKPPAGSPATWTAEQREANQREIDRKRLITDGRKAAQHLVMSMQAEIGTVVSAIDLGEKNLINAEMIAKLRRAVDLLESRLEASK